MTLHLTADGHTALEVVAQLRGMTPAGALLDYVAELGERVEKLLDDLVGGDLVPMRRSGRDELH